MNSLLRPLTVLAALVTASVAEAFGLTLVWGFLGMFVLQFEKSPLVAAAAGLAAAALGVLTFRVSLPPPASSPSP